MSLKGRPQGLKPRGFIAPFGPAEAVPLLQSLRRRRQQWAFVMPESIVPVRVFAKRWNDNAAIAMNKLEYSSLYQLTLTRLKLTLREPEAIFWIFVFPIILAVGLGIAFRNRPADVLPVAATTPQLAQALSADKGLRASQLDEAQGRHALAVGTILLLAEQSPDGVVYRYDDTN